MMTKTSFLQYSRLYEDFSVDQNIYIFNIDADLLADEDKKPCFVSCFLVFFDALTFGKVSLKLVRSKPSL